MRYTVFWTPAAEEGLAAVWLRSEDRRQVTLAAHAIDAALREDPQQRGESRAGTVRILFAPPLGAKFEVLTEDRTVYVLGVWAIRNA